MTAPSPRRTRLQRLRTLMRTAFRRASSQDLEDEIGAYVEELTSKHVRAGRSPQDARRAALLEAGGVEQVKEATRSVHPWHEAVMCWRDARYAARSLRRAPAFTATILATLAVGVATATAIFTVAHHVLLRPLPYPEPDRIVAVEPGGVQVAYSAGSVAAEARALPEFTALGFYAHAGINLSHDDAPLRLTAAAATSGFFEVLGVPVLHGRPLLPADDRRGRVAILSFRLWSGSFGGDPSVIGRPIRLNDQPFEIVGVMPPGFAFPAGVDVWVPPFSDTQMAGQAIVARVIGRLAPDVSLAQADHALASIRPASPDQERRTEPMLSTLQDRVTQEARPTLLLLTSTAAVLFAATVVNVAGLMLLRLRSRERELLVQVALGAGRVRIIRRVLVEMGFLGIAGGTFGILAAAVGIRAFRSMGSSLVALELPATLDWRVAAVGAMTAVVIVCAVALGLAIVVARTTPASIVRGTTSRSRRSSATNATLVVAQIACAVAILVAASSVALLTNRLARVDLGYDNAQAVVFDVTLPRFRYGDRFAVASFTDELIGRLQALGGVTAVGATTLGPGGQGVMLGTAMALDEPDPALAAGEDGATESSAGPTGIAMSATPDYFRGLGIPLVAGRYFEHRDTAEGPPVAILTVSAARALAHEPLDLIGRRLVASRATGGVSREIVGVVGDIRPMRVEPDAPPFVYSPLSQTPSLVSLAFVVSGIGPPGTLIASIRRTVDQLDAGLPLYDVRTIEDVRRRLMQTERLTATLTAAFSAVALVLAGVGLFGAMAQDVAGRRREIGIRMALGAQASTLRWSFLRGALTLSAIGIGCGAVLATVGWQAAAAIVTPLEAPGMGLLAVDFVVVLAASAAAAWIPAARAARVDPALTLRSE